MVETISPVVHGGRTRAFWRAVVAHVLGATGAAALFGAALGALARVLDAPWGTAGYLLLALVAGIYALRETFDLPVPVPDRHRQVPEWWRTFYSRDVAAALYGAGLGIGFLTFLTYGTYVAVVAGAFLSGDPATASLICGTFGFTRSVVLIAAPGLDALEAMQATKQPRLVNAAACWLVVIAAAVLWVSG